MKLLWCATVLFAIVMIEEVVTARTALNMTGPKGAAATGRQWNPFGQPLSGQIPFWPPFSKGSNVQAVWVDSKLINNGTSHYGTSYYTPTTPKRR